MPFKIYFDDPSKEQLSIRDRKKVIKCRWLLTKNKITTAKQIFSIGYTSVNCIIKSFIDLIVGSQTQGQWQKSKPNIIWINYNLFLKIFAATMPLFYGATGTLCFRLWLTMLMGFKARVNAPSPVLCHLHVIDPWSQL